jgi:hypothetical protein
MAHSTIEMRKAMIRFAAAFIILFSIGAAISALGADKAKLETEYLQPFRIVSYSAAPKELPPLADDIAKFVGTPIVMASDKNPVCCVRLEITGWTPNSGKGGYIIVNQPGGSIIQASDLEQMKLAVERFKSSAKKMEGHVLVPQGLLTNYSVVP